MVFAAFSALWGTLAALLARPPYAFGPSVVGVFGLIGLLGPVTAPVIGAIVDRIGPRNTICAGAIALGLAFAFVAAGGSSLAWLVVGIVFVDLGNRAGFVANQARIYALRPEARGRLNTVFMVSYFLGGAAGAALGGYAVQRDGWIGVAMVGAVFSLGAVAINALAYRASRAALVGGEARRC
jgi:predicted MFS family arabinose efflux permease